MIKTSVKMPIGYNKDDLYLKITQWLPVTKEEIKELNILRRALNLSDKGNIHYDMTVSLSLDPERERGLLNMRKKVSLQPDLTLTLPISTLSSRPVVIGAGPAGLFCALALAEAGARPILYERGLPVDERYKAIKRFNALGILDPECNVQYGEGGAGAYSDGKLKSGSPDKYKMKVLTELANHGAPEEILYSAAAHIGTDILPGVVKSIRKKLISHGAEVHFSSKLVGINSKDGKITGGRVIENGKEVDFECERLVLATGHSAYGVFHLLESLGVALEPRGFGIGVRIEHRREYINRLILGDNPPEGVGTASYRLVTHLPSGRSVYSFCMCPGGEVVAATSEAGSVVTNGMSEYKRMADNSNSALLVSVTPEDFPEEGPLGGLVLQKEIESAAFRLSDGSYLAPSQRLDDFIKDRKTAEYGRVTPSYQRGTVKEKIDGCLPGYITDSLRAGISDFDAWLPGYYESDAVLTAPETRSTSPVRVLRTEGYEAFGIKGLYPIGEGAGYSGGIVSSARDGVMCAEAILLEK